LEKKNKQPNNYVRYSGFGFQILGALLIAVWAGQKLDNYYHSELNLFTIVLSLLAIAASLYQLFKMINK